MIDKMAGDMPELDKFVIVRYIDEWGDVKVEEMSGLEYTWLFHDNNVEIEYWNYSEYQGE
jgi:hypothetical protein